MTTIPQPALKLEILDLRHVSGQQLAPLLRDEADHWQARHRWDYTRSVDLLIEYLDSRILPGYVALDAGHHILGYTFCVFEAEKAVIGDIYAFGEAQPSGNPISATLLMHLLEMLQATPGLRRIESQLLMYPAGALTATFAAHGFRSFPRLFMLAPLNHPALATPPTTRNDHSLRLEHWQPEAYQEAAALIHRCYQGHGDAEINDQYRSISGAQRFLHNIIRFPGCGTFDTESSLLLRNAATDELVGMLLSSIVRHDAAHITQLCIHPDLRGLGLGHLLLHRCAEDLRRRGLTAVSLTVTEANQKARALYESLGFAPQTRFEAMTWDKKQTDRQADR